MSLPAHVLEKPHHTTEHWSNNEIRDTIDSMHNLIKTKYPTLTIKQRGKKLQKKYRVFANRYPTLFSNVVEGKTFIPEFIAFLDTTLGRKQDIDDGLKTHYNASVEQGEDLAEKYLYPKVGRPNESDLN